MHGQDFGGARVANMTVSQALRHGPGHGCRASAARGRLPKLPAFDIAAAFAAGQPAC